MRTLLKDAWMVFRFETRTLFFSPVNGAVELLLEELEELPHPASNKAIPVAAQNVRRYFVRRIID
jgi:hypothetical protein